MLTLGFPLITANARPIATQYFNQGLEKCRARNYQGSIVDFAKVIEIYPQNADAYDKRDLARCNSEEYQAAIFDWSKKIEINSRDVLVYY